MNKCVNNWLGSNMIYIATELQQTTEYNSDKFDQSEMFFVHLFCYKPIQKCATTFAPTEKQKTNRKCSVVLLKSQRLLKQNIICLLPPLNTLWGHVNILRDQNSCTLRSVHSDCNKFVRDAHIT